MKIELCNLEVVSLRGDTRNTEIVCNTGALCANQTAVLRDRIIKENDGMQIEKSDTVTIMAIGNASFDIFPRTGNRRLHIQL